MVYQAYKLGDVQGGNWNWAVGFPSPYNKHGMICLMTMNTINLFDPAFKGVADAERLSHAIAAHLNYHGGEV